MSARSTVHSCKSTRVLILQRLLLLLTSVVLVAAGGGGGGGWSAATIPTTETLRSVHFVDATHGWAAGYNGTILHTSDGATTWSAQSSGTTQRFLAVHFLDSNTGWALAGRIVLRTTDGGTTWVNANVDTSVFKFRNSLFAVSTTQAWAPASSSGVPTTSRWFSRLTVQGDGTVVEQDFDVMVSGSSFFDMFFTDPDNGWSVGMYGQIRRITDATSGSPAFAFQTSGTTVQLNGVFMLDANTGWVVGNGGKILKTTNGGVTWSTLTSGTTTNLRDAHFVDASSGWVAGESGLILHTTDGGTTWTPETSGVTTTLWSVRFAGAGFAAGGDLAGGANGVLLKMSETTPSTVAFGSGTSSVMETAGAHAVTVTLVTADGNPSAGPVTVEYVTGNNTATAGSDYTATPGTVTFPAGSESGSTQAIEIAILDDLIYELDETFTITLQNPAGASLGATTTHTVTIQSDEPLPALTVNDKIMAEGNSGTSQLTLTVYLSAPSSQTVTVNYATANGSATAGSDYVAIPLTLLTLLPGEISKAIPVTVNGDTAFELDETFTLNLSSATDATISHGQGVGTVTNDDAAAGNWMNVGSLARGRHRHTATLLQNGKVLVAGGYNPVHGDLASAELYDPATGTWSATGSMNQGRAYPTATLLRDGKVLVAGGFHDGNLNSAEIYNPATGSWTPTGSMNVARFEHTLTVLSNGKVLATGGYAHQITAELYDPATGTWSLTASMSVGRDDHVAVLLANGKVLVAGTGGGNSILTTEMYDPATGTWATTGDLNVDRHRPAATLLPNGMVLLAGGYKDGWGGQASAELYNPTTGLWTMTGSMATSRMHPATVLLPGGKVLVVSGQGPTTLVELYDPESGTWSLTGSLNALRDNPTATLLADGSVLVAAGAYTTALTSAEIYRPAGGSWSGTGSMANGRFAHTVTLLADGSALAVGGGTGAIGVVAGTERYNPATALWSSAGNLDTATRSHSATLLPNGKVLVAGGYDNSNTNYARAELFDPTAGTWTLTGSMNVAREEHHAVLLPNGKVLVAGGADSGFNALASAELYDPATGLWAMTGSFDTGRRFATLTLLPNGKVLAAGGQGLNSAEIYDPQTGAWTATGNLNVARWTHTATLLPNGKVLVAGSNGGAATAELYDPSTGTWTLTADMNQGRYSHMATLLPDGRVLVTGGFAGSSLNSSEIYDPVSGKWTSTPSMGGSRVAGTAALLLGGRVLVAGGGFPRPESSAEIFDEGLGFSQAWRPVLSTATSPLVLGQALVATGSQFKGISEASAGHGQSSATNYPLVQLRSLANEQLMFLPLDSTAGWTGTSFKSIALNDFPPGHALATVFTNAIPSISRMVLVSGAPSNQPPVAHAGPDQTVPIGALVTLDGSASSDPNDDTLSYAWSQLSGPAVALSSATVPQPTFTPTMPGTYVFQLDVHDGHGGTSSDTVQITVQDTTPPTVTVTSPNGGEKVFTTASYLITWTASDDDVVSFFDVFFSVNGGVSYAPVPGCTGVAGTARGCTWNAPGPITTAGRIRVTAHDASGNTASDDSDANYSVATGTGTITVTAPNTALSWAVGTTKQITWKHTLGASACVRIELSRNGGTAWEEIAASVKNSAATTGVFDWTVIGPVTSAARVRVSWTPNPAVADTSNVNFTILEAYITMTAPTASGMWGYGTLQRVTWATNLASGDKVHLRLSVDGGVTFPLVLASSVTASLKKVNVTIPTLAAPTTLARVRVEWAASPATNGTNPANFKVQPPYVTVTRPNTVKHLWAIGTTQKVSWTSNLGALENVKIELSLDGGATYTVVLAASTPSDGSLLVPVQGAWATTHGRVRVTWLKDGSVVDVSNADFVIQ